MTAEDDDYLNWADASTSSEYDLGPAEQLTPGRNGTGKVREQLRNRFLYDGAISALTNFMETKVATQQVPNPFVRSPMGEDRLRLLLCRYVKAQAILVFQRLSVIDKELPEELAEALAEIDTFNAEILEAIKTIGGFTREIVECSREHCRKFVVKSMHFSSTRGVDVLEMSEIEAENDSTDCVSSDCSHSSRRSTWHIVFEPGMYNERMELVQKGQRKILSLCRDHMVLFELFFLFSHMEWNVNLNCKKFIAPILSRVGREKTFDQLSLHIPNDFYMQLMVFYMARYNLLWAFGEAKDWIERGFTLLSFIETARSE